MFDRKPQNSVKKLSLKEIKCQRKKQAQEIREVERQKKKKNQCFFGPGRKVPFPNDESQYPKSDAPGSWTPL